MEQAQQAWGVSAPAQFQQLDDNLESRSPALWDLGSFQAEFPGSITSPGASLIPSPAILGFVTPQFASLPPSQSPNASLIPSPANYAALSGFEGAPSTCLLSCAAYGQNHAEEAPTGSLVPSSAYIAYHSQTIEPSLPQPEGFPNYALVNQVIVPQNSAYRECQYPASGQNFEQNIWLQHPSNTAHQFSLRHYDNSNHVPSDLEQIPGPVNSNSRQKSQRCIRCLGLRQKVFLFS
jgi:hypothetical protein